MNVRTATARLSTLKGNRYLTFLLLILTVFVLAACSRPTNASDVLSDQETGFTPVALEELPAELGRSFPVAQSVEKGGGINPGDAAPDFTVALADGRGFRLKDLKGRPVVLNFWATWCGPCRAEMPEFVKLSESSSDLVVLEVNVQEDLEAIQPFAEEFNMSMPVVVDEPGMISKAYQVQGMPTTYFIDRDGKIAARWVGLLNKEFLDMFTAQIQ